MTSESENDTPLAATETAQETTNSEAASSGAEQENTEEGQNQNQKKSDAETESGPKADPDEIGGPSGPEPTRYGDWEIGGKCVDF